MAMKLNSRIKETSKQTQQMHQIQNQTNPTDKQKREILDPAHGEGKSPSRRF